MEKGMIHIYCGNGKGKTSILNGMVVRAVGANLNIKYLRFLKNRETSENKVLNKIGIEVESSYQFSTKFIWEMNEAEREMFKQETLNGIENLKKYLQDDSIDLILLDEILGVVENKFITEDELITLLLNRNPKIEVALSGRKIFKKLEDIADLISVVEPKKHYFEKKVIARLGIEY